MNIHLDKDATMEYNSFIFNENGVCINPEEIVILDNGRTNLIVKVCEVPGGWVTGCNYYLGAGSGGASPAHLPCAEHHVVYPTKDEAIRVELKCFENAYYEYFGKAIKEYLAPKTMQLFD